MQITLIRHTAVAVSQGICYGQSDVDVADSFQTEAAGVKLQLDNMKFDKVFCSPLIRCRKLADFCGYPNPQIETRIMELNFGDWELKSWDNINDPQLEKWYNNWIDEAPTNGESLAEMIQRVENFYIELKQTELQNIAIFTHAGVIRIFEILINKVSSDKAFDIKIEYGEVIIHTT